MANNKITWNDKVSLVTDPTIAEINKVTDDNMNEIKNVVNENADQVIVRDTEPTSADNELWVDTSSNATYINSEIANQYGTANNLGYSQEYINDNFQERSNFSYTLNNGIKFNFFKVGRIVQFEIEGTASSITAGTSYSTTIDNSLAPSNDFFRTNFKYAEGSSSDSDYFGYATIIRDTNTNVVTATFRSQKAQSSTTYPRVELCYISK